MNKAEAFLSDKAGQDFEDIDLLIDLASLVRELIDAGLYEQINRIIGYTVEHGYLKALSWCIGLLQEAFDRDDCPLDDFECPLGRSIPDYDAFTAQLQVDFLRPRNDLEKVCDKNGEVTSFFNILIYNTGYRHIYFVSTENFDTKDNDYVQYKLFFTRTEGHGN